VLGANLRCRKAYGQRADMACAAQNFGLPLSTAILEARGARWFRLCFLAVAIGALLFAVGPEANGAEPAAADAKAGSGQPASAQNDGLPAADSNAADKDKPKKKSADDNGKGPQDGTELSNKKETAPDSAAKSDDKEKKSSG